MDKEILGGGQHSITTSDIARLCGLSRSTVSAVLNGKRKVRESTRRKVLDCIREHNYETGMISKALVGEMSRMVAVLAPNIGSPFQMMVFRGLNEVLDAEGYHLLFHNVRPEDRQDPQTVASLHAYRPAGFIILKGAEGPNGEHAQQVIEKDIPLVTQGEIDGVETHTVTFDNRAGMKNATDYVIERGHERIGHIAGPIFSKAAKDRKLGFIESLIEHNIPVTDSIIVDASLEPDLGYAAALAILKDPNTRPTALLCFNDLMAMNVYRAAHELSLDIPHDLSVVGFDGIDFVELLGPPLTTVDIHPEEMGRQVAALLLNAIRKETGRGFETLWVKTNLIERDSVRRIARPHANEYNSAVGVSSDSGFAVDNHQGLITTVES